MLNMSTSIRKRLEKLKFLGLATVMTAPFITGCRIVGNPPDFDARVPQARIARSVPAPSGLPVNHLLKMLKRPESPETLADIGSKRQQNNSAVIHYPGWRLAKEEEVVCSDPHISVDVTIDSEDLKNVREKLKKGESKIAMLDFKNEAGTEGASGRLAADFFYRAFIQSANEKDIAVQIQDRKEIKDIIFEEAKLKQELLDQSEESIVNTRKKINYTGYILSGAVTSYNVENREFEFRYRIDEKSFAAFYRDVSEWRKDYIKYINQYEQDYLPAYAKFRREFLQKADLYNDSYEDYEREYEVYVKKYAEYSKKYRSYVKGIKARAVLADVATTGVLTLFTRGRFPFKAVPAERQKLSPKIRKADFGKLPPPYPKYEWPEELPNVDSEKALERNLKAFYRTKNWTPRPEKRIATVCNIGITFRLADAQTSKIICIGNGDVRHVSPQAGMKSVCGKATEELFLKIFGDINSKE